MSSRAASAGVAAPSLDISRGGQLENDLTTLWLLSCSFLVFFMQCGFALLEAGSIRFKNTKNILLKNVMNTCLGALLWWGLGQAFAHGECGGASNPIIGLRDFFASNASQASLPQYWTNWLFGWVFAAVSVTIPSGALAERCQFRAYLVYTVVQVALVYPVVVHWVWSTEGWLSPFRRDCATGQPDVLLSKSEGLIDFAGSGNVHMTGGSAALMGAIIMGPRIGRFTADGHVADFPACNPTQQALGTFILWLGWYGFNAGSTGCMYGCMALAAKVAVNTTLAAAAAGSTVLFLETLRGRPGDIGPMLNGILSGLVSITSACGVVEAYAAVIIGAVAGIVYVSSSALLRHVRIDDPLDAAPVHFFNGIWGLLCVGLFATKTDVEQAYGAYGPAKDWGVFYGGAGYQLGVQLLGTAAIAAWACSTTGLLWWALKRLGCLRVSAKVEEEGLDHSQGIGTGMVAFCGCLDAA